MIILKATKVLILFSVLLLSGCKTNQTKNKEKEGRWVYQDTVNGISYKSKGKYKKGIEVNSWRYYANKKRIKKEKYKNGICYVTTYFENGKTESKGKTKLAITDTETHWFYFGDWLFYDKNGQLISVKSYVAGELVNEVKN